MPQRCASVRPPKDGSLRRLERNQALLRAAREQSTVDAAQELARINRRDLDLAQQVATLVLVHLRKPDLTTRDLYYLARTAESVQRVSRLAIGAATIHELKTAAPDVPANLDILTTEELRHFKALLHRVIAFPRASECGQ